MAEPVRAGFPVGFTIVLIVAVLLFGVAGSTIADSRSSDAAGNAMSAGFGAIFAGAFWIALVVMLIMAWARGVMVSWAPIALLVLVPAAAVAFFIAMGRFGGGDKSALVAILVLPILLMLYAVWARFARLHGVLPPAATSAALLSAVGVVSIAVFALGLRAALPDPARDAALAEQAKVQQEQMAKEARGARGREASEFAALGPDSSVADYLSFIHSGTYGDRALEGIQKVKTRQADAVSLLSSKPLADLADLWQFNVVPTREVCEAYGNALTAAANRIGKTNSNYIGAAIDIEWQLPNLKWLVTAKCDLSGPLERAETNIRAVADSPRLTNFADTLADIRRARP